MRLVSVKNCTTGQLLAKSIYNENGVILLNVNAELNQSILNRLLKLGIEYIYIHDPLTDDVVLEDPISEETRFRAITTIRSSFQQLRDEGHAERPFNYFRSREFKQVMAMILDDLENNQQAMMMLSMIPATDRYLYQHSLNVCIYATMLGISTGMNREELMTLGLGALFHDIGKTQIPEKILHKPGKLTAAEFEQMKEHTTFGFELLKDEPNISLLVAHCALQHHERIDGSGYPRNLKGDQIHDYARWIGMVDAYDAMTSNRVYRDGMLPHQAMEWLYTQSGILFDHKKVEVFRNRFAIYPLGVTVQLHTGEVGVVVDINTSTPHRPIVRIIRDIDGQPLTQPYEIDMSKKLEVMIAKVNDIDVETHSKDQ